ncbi:MAG TPA: S8 family peptidase, partial [Bdellovibrionota bacterium]|nr:S8 family peptidase [Bdellovibrionota bacterium]
MKKVLVAFLMLFPMIAFADDRPPFKPGEVIVKYKTDRSSRGATIQMASQAMEEAQSSGYRVAHYHYGLNISQMKVPPSKTVEKAIEEISAIEGVEYVEPNYRVYFNALGGERIEEIDLGKWLQPSSPTSFSTPKVIVAVIDTGVDYTHEGLNPFMWVNRGEVPQNGIDDDRNGFVDDYYGYNFITNNGDPMDDNYHGTHVAGIVVKTLADAENADPSAEGLRSSVGIMALKFLNKDGEGYVSDAIRAVSYAISMGAKVLNNSWGGGNFSRALQDAISQTYYNNRLFVVASGNDAKNIDQFPAFPASYTHPHLVSVAALDSFSSYGLAWFSNFGK